VGDNVIEFAQIGWNFRNIRVDQTDIFQAGRFDGLETLIDLLFGVIDAHKFGFREQLSHGEKIDTNSATQLQNPGLSGLRSWQREKSPDRGQPSNMGHRKAVGWIRQRVVGIRCFVLAHRLKF